MPGLGDQNFPDIPPFPLNIPTAPLLQLSIKKLQHGDSEESNRLFEACKELGFFYLDLRGSAEGEMNLKAADELFGVGKELFNLDLEEKSKYKLLNSKSWVGYKGYGKTATDEKGTPDRNEIFKIYKNGILGLTSSPYVPDLVSHYQPVFESYIRSAHAISTVLLTHLSHHLHLPNDSHLPKFHRLTAMSSDQVNYVRSDPQPASDRQVVLGEHTDFGSFTILFNRLSGLQVRLPGDANAPEDWAYVRPLPHHAIVNVGDALTKFTHGLLRSATHRLVPPVGKQAEIIRYSLCYFARPEDDVVLKRLEGGDIIPPFREGEEREEELTSKEWVYKAHYKMSRKAVLAKQAMGNGLGSEKTGEAEKVSGERKG